MKPSFQFEESAQKKGFRYVVGVDEAGRGPLAGPVVAAAVCLNGCVSKREVKGIKDSKLLSEKKREELFTRLTETLQMTWHYAVVSVEEIDRDNIYQATRSAMELALCQFVSPPDWVLIDGRPFRDFPFPHEGIVSGDRLSYSIAAASIIAKVVRDRLMREWHQQWPHYGFDEHKGYGTPQHLEALKRYGPCPIHRNSFAPVMQAIGQKAEC
ncbi:MAG: ribonuclease HII [Verrucomicrobiae bacterium]|nr:ribonuclease HII [Verrucomicrobiae bacterium]